MDIFCDVVMLTYNKLDFTRQCISSFLSNTHIPCRLILIDNASTDGTKEYLTSLKDTANCRIKLVFNEDNRGFVGGMNQGVKISTAPYVCLANNDLLFTEGWLDEAISIFKKYASIGLLNPDSNSLGTHVPVGVSLKDFGRQLYSKRKGIFSEMPFCVGYCMLIKREVIEKVGGLSEEFYPMFFEDSDYSLKVKKAGYLTGVAKGSYVWHKEHASLKQIPEKEKIFVNSREKFIKKWGRILRIAWVVSSKEELIQGLSKAVELSRGGNYIWVFSRGFLVNREEVFSQTGLVDNSGINFTPFKNRIELWWKIVKKKKKYDVIIDKKNMLGRNFFKNALKEFDSQIIENIKKHPDSNRDFAK